MSLSDRGTVGSQAARDAGMAEAQSAEKPYLAKPWGHFKFIMSNR